MQFTEDEASEVKKWVVRKLEDISDADSDVLADYVLALIRSDAPNDEIRKASVENLEDFLREHTASFVDELFATFGPKTQQQQQHEAPGAMSAPQQPTPFNPPSGPSRAPYGYPQGPGPQDGASFSRKRSYNDSEQEGGEEQPSYNNRAYKTPRRGRGGGRGDWMGRDSRPVPGGPGFPQPSGPGGFPVMPSAFPGFDQNDPMAAMMALQGMGFPQMPGMPPMPMPPAVPGQQPQPDQMEKSSERCPFYETQGICYLGATCPYQHDTASKKEDEYDPKSSGIMSDTQHRRGSDRGRGRGRGGRGGDHGGFGARGRRSEFSAAGPNEDTSITTIVVEQIPEEKLNEESVRDFFSQYGDIVDLSLQPHRKLALVTYDSHGSAKQAWSSPKVIFDNRFVKVYWHKPKTDARGGSSGGAGEGNGAPEVPAFNQEEFERQQEEAQKAYEEKTQRRKETEEAKQALEQQRDDLLRKQQEERERLLQRIHEKGGGSTNGSSNDAMATDDGSGTAAAADDENVSDQTKQLRAQLAFLEAEAKSLGLDPSKSETGAPFGSRGRGRGGFPGYRGRGFYAPRGRGYDPSYRGRGRGAFRGGGRGGVMRLDNRPRRIAVSGVDNPDKDEGLRQYLIGLGEYESIEPNADQPDTLTVAFKERYQAEKFMFGSWNIPSVGEVQLTWLPNPPLPTASASIADGNVAGQDVSDKTSAAAAAAAADDDMTGMDHENENENGLDSRKELPAGAHDVDYDVAEMDDNWGG